MKKSVLTLCVAVAALGILPLTTQAVPFTAGNVVIYRVGDGTAALSNVGTAVFLDEYTPAGTLVQSYALPTTTTGGATPLVASGSAASEGFLTTSADGRFLVLPGYTAAAGTAGIAATTSAAVPRQVATVSNSGALVQTTLNNYSATNIRSAASPDGSLLYAAGNANGIISLTSGVSGTAGTVVSTTSTNNRSVGVFNNQLYLSTASGTTLRLATVGTGLPTTTGQVATEVPGLAVAGINTPSAFLFASLGATGDTIYVADNGNNAIQKYSLNAGTFTLTGTATLTGITGLTGRTVAGTEQLFATTPTGLYLLSDATGAGGTLAGTPTLIASVATNEAFRGIALAPIAVPEPSTVALLALCGLGAVVVLRRRTANVAA